MLFLALSLPWPLKPLLYTPCIRFFIYDISLYLSKKKKQYIDQRRTKRFQEVQSEYTRGHHIRMLPCSHPHKKGNRM